MTPELRRSPAALPLLALTVILLASLSGCGSDSETTAGEGRLRVVASFYPLEFLVHEIGGSAVDVEDLTKPGAEPHDLELTPRDVAQVADADLVVYLSRLQPAVDDAVDQADTAHVFDVAGAADLTKTFTPIEEGEAHEDEADSVDPHFWLDPQRYADVARAVGERLIAAAPDDRATFSANLDDLVARIDQLDEEFRSGLAQCERTDIVTSHNAFGYLAERYGLRQHGITGLTPEAEPNADRLASITDFVRDHDVRTIYFETLVSPAVADAVASETGADTAVLDPIEGLTDQSSGDDYLAVMRSNLQTLRRGQSCG